MKIFVYFIMCVWMFKMQRVVCMNSDVNTKLNNYLHEKSAMLQNAFSKKKYQLSKGGSKNVEFQAMRNITYESNTGHIKLFTFFETNYFLSGKDLLSISAKPNNNESIVNLHQNLEKFSDGQRILFTKAVVFEQLGLTLSRLELGEAHIYGYNKDKHFFIQSLFIPFSSDAHFFVCNSNLYLIVVGNRGENLVPTTIYKWLGYHFDEIQTIFSTGAIKVTSFGSNTSRIIIILQNVPNQPVMSEIYEFRNGEMKRIQYIQTENPINVNTYISKHNTYVVVYQKSRENTVYHWDGLQMTKVNKFETEGVITKSEIFTANGSSILIIPLLDKLQIYSLFSEKIKLEEEMHFQSNYSAVLEIHSHQSGRSITTFIAGSTEDNTIVINIVSFKTNFDDLENDSEDRNVLRECFNTLEQKIYDMRNKINVTKTKLFISSDVADSGPTEDYSKAILSDELKIETEIERSLRDAKSRIKLVNSFLNNYTFTHTDSIIVNGDLIIKGSVKSDEMTGINVSIKSANGQKWVPEQWLKYEEPQTITGPVKIKNVLAKYLETSSDDQLMKDILLKTGNQTIAGLAFIGNLTADKIYAEKINDVPMKMVFLRNNPQPIRGVKTFKNLNADEVKVKFLNEDQPANILPLVVDDLQSKTNFDSNVVINNLEVETIDGVDWNEFASSVFRIEKDSEIVGPLTFSKLKTVKLHLKKLRNVDVGNFLTTSTDQTIQSDLEFNHIFAENITAETVNGIKLNESVVSFGQDEPITGPVTFEKLNVVKNLEVAGKLDNSLFWRSGDHIIGTNESDLLQRYSGKVKIKGNVHLKNLSLQPKTKLIVSDKEMNADLHNIYWTKSTNQKLETHLTAQLGISTPHILTNVLNDVKFNQYMLNDNKEKMETDYHFETVSVKGNVILKNTAKHHPDVNRLGKEAVKTNGSFIISGKKTYTDTLRTENLATLELDGIDTLEVLNTKWPANVTGTKSFKDLTIIGDLNASHAHVQIINGVNVEQFKNEVIFIDQPMNISKKNFDHVEVSDLFVTKLNDHSIDEYVSSSKRKLSSARIDNLIIKGNITIDNVSELETINGIPLDDLLNKVPMKGDRNGIVGDVHFAGKVTIDDLATSFINNVDLEERTKSFLFRKYDQTIVAPYSFGSIKSGNILTSKINNTTLDSILDVSSEMLQEIHVPKETQFLKAVFTSIEAKQVSPCSVSDLVSEIREPSPQNWSEMQIKGNVTLLDDGNILYRIFENSVKTNTKNIVYAPVKFSGHVRAENVDTQKSINNVDLAGILDDAVLTDSDSQQIITGQKWFSTLRANEAKILTNADIRFVNGEDIHDLNVDLVDKSKLDRIVIKGKKTFFAGLQTDKLHSKIVSNSATENIVELSNPRKVPRAIFDSLDIKNDLNITIVNNINFQNVLRNRLVTNGVDNQTAKGIFFFENVEVKNLFTPRINDMKVDNMIFDLKNQTISSTKRFTKKIEVFGDITIDFINGIPVSEEHAKSLMLSESVSINGSIRVLRPSKLDGIVATDSINGYSIAEINEILAKGNIRTEVREIYDIKNRVIESVQHNINAVKDIPAEYMYLEKSDELQISVPNTVSASTVESKGYVLIHVTGYESGESCGLPSSCECPMQYTMEISPEHSVTTFPNRGSQRIFSYDDENMIVYFITNSVSTSSNCSTGTTKVMNEVSMLTWNTISTPNTTGHFYQYNNFITGHISKVEFFTLENKTYVIIGRYYDPVLDNYNLDCTVIKFNENRTAAEEIQKIPTKAVHELHLFHTAQGVVLIIGSTRNSRQYNEEDETQILRFNPAEEKFQLLRTIPLFGCSDAAGVVLGTDSLIILAHKLAPIQVLKYYPDFDNYYFYQSFELDEPVIGISAFYIGSFGMSDAYLCIITDNENYFIYEFRFLEGWKMKSHGELNGLKNFVPFELNRKSYIFAPSSEISSLLTIVKNGSD